MNLCPTGHELPQGARFCPQCGASAPGGRSRTLLLTVAAALVAVLAAVAVVVVIRPWSTGPDNVPIPPTPTFLPPPTTVAPPTTTAETIAETTGEAPDQVLADQATLDRPTVEGLVGYWVPQVSSKAVGLFADGRTYTDEDIVTDHQHWVDRFSDAVLLRSGDYSSFANPNFWVTVVAQTFSSAGEANGWCAAQRLAVDDCFAKFLSHTAGPSGSTVHR